MGPQSKNINPPLLPEYRHSLRLPPCLSPQARGLAAGAEDSPVKDEIVVGAFHPVEQQSCQREATEFEQLREVDESLPSGCGVFIFINVNKGRAQGLTKLFS